LLGEKRRRFRSTDAQIGQASCPGFSEESPRLVTALKEPAMSMIKILAPAVLIGCGSLAALAANAPQAIVTPLLTKALPDLPGKEAVMITVEYPPGSVDPIHRHDAHAFIYVLEGSIVMQVKGGKEVTLTPGQTFYEGPNDVHVVGRNASTTKTAKFVVTFIKKQGAPILTPAA
jgi:quercetin dioxygenase-like cupin family protein